MKKVISIYTLKSYRKHLVILQNEINRESKF